MNPQEQIASLAYSYYAARGYQDGFAEEDWLKAERVVLTRVSANRNN